MSGLVDGSVGILFRMFHRVLRKEHWTRSKDFWLDLCPTLSEPKGRVQVVSNSVSLIVIRLDVFSGIIS